MVLGTSWFKRVLYKILMKTSTTCKWWSTGTLVKYWKPCFCYWQIVYCNPVIDLWIKQSYYKTQASLVFELFILWSLCIFDKLYSTSPSSIMCWNGGKWKLLTVLHQPKVPLRDRSLWSLNILQLNHFECTGFYSYGMGDLTWSFWFVIYTVSAFGWMSSQFFLMSIVV